MSEGRGGDGRGAARKLAAGAASMYVATLVSTAIQLGYAAITARTVGVAGFGYYAIALASAQLVSPLVSGPVVASAGRLLRVDGPQMRALARLALALAAVGGLAMLVAAPIWAWLWGEPEALAPLMFVSLSVFMAPITGLSTATLRRLGRFKALSVATVIANVTGMAVGVAAVLYFRSPASLLVSALVGQVVLAAACGWLGRSVWRVHGPDARVRDFRRYGTTIAGSRLLGVLAGFVGRFAAVHALGANALGYWNRAEVVSTVPIQQVQGAIVQAVYPEFRHDIESPARAHRVWPDLLGLVAWFMWPVMAFASVAVFAVVPFLFGAGWDSAEPIASVLLLCGAIQIPTIVLAAAIEALGRRRWIFAEQATVLTVQLVGAGLTVATRSLWPAIIAVGMALVAQHAVDLTLCVRSGYVSGARLASHYGGALAAAAVAAAVGYLTLVVSRGESDALRTLALALVFVGLGTVAWIARRRLTPFALVAKYAGPSVARRLR